MKFGHILKHLVSFHTTYIIHYRIVGDNHLHNVDIDMWC